MSTDRSRLWLGVGRSRCHGDKSIMRVHAHRVEMFRPIAIEIANFLFAEKSCNSRCSRFLGDRQLFFTWLLCTKRPFDRYKGLKQWSSTFRLSGSNFMRYWGWFCDLRDLGGDFCSVSILNFLIDYKKTIFVTLKSKQMMHLMGVGRGARPPLEFEIISKKRLFFQFPGVKNKFHRFGPLEKILGKPPSAPPGRNLSDARDVLSTPWFVIKGYKIYRSGHVTIKLSSFCVTLHCTNYPRTLRFSLVESQALRFSQRLWTCKYFVETNVQNKIKE